MRFGYILPNLLSPVSYAAAIKTSARLAEDVGFESIWGTDHILMPEAYPQYGKGTESITTLAYLAAATEHFALGLSVLVLPMRNPLVTAKQLATIAHLSGRELIVGIGVGWNQDEYRFLKANFKRRGKLANEYITIMRKLWSEEKPEYEGTYTFSGVMSSPLLDPLPKIWIGGHSDAALQRTAALGGGYHPNPVAADEYVTRVARIREMSGDKPITMSMRLTLDLREGSSQAIDQLHQLAKAGLEYPAVGFQHETLAELVGQIEIFGRDVIPALRD